ncbi:polyphosphate kinase 2 [Accumulibacter sp.]|uniref:polyphosphate kinase 2 n=1 Tax=Accumulibacter sp. TaxID=2053492 RepID=UPI003DAA0D6E
MSELKPTNEEAVTATASPVASESGGHEVAVPAAAAAPAKATGKASARAAKAAEQPAESKPAKAKSPKSAKSANAKPDTAAGSSTPTVGLGEVVPVRKPKMDAKTYEKALSKLQIELVKLQEWIKFKKLKVVVIFEGRDAAGKGGCIKRITESLSPRVTRVAALPAPTEREATSWYFQRYVQHLPAGGEMVLFDRSWYNRAGVERVMGFCTEEEYREFLRTCPEFERMLVRSGIILIKYWFSVSNEEQERRFQKRIFHPEKHWKLSPMDLQSRARWVEYSKAKDAMFAHTDIKQAPWYVVNGDDKMRARLNVMTHLLNMIDYEDLTPQPIVLPPRQDEGGYVRPPLSDQTFIPEIY